MRSLKGFLAVVVTNLIFVLPAMAEEVAVTGGTSWGTKYIGLGIAVIGGALGQGKTAAAALEGISRNPGASGQMFLPMILGLALIESLVLLAFLIAGGLI